MSFDPITLALAANKAKSDLTKNGQVGYTETSAPVVVIPNGSYEFSQGALEVEATQFPKEGDLIALTLDGTVHSGTAKSVLADDMEGVFIGNASVLGGVDTGENYMVGFVPVIGMISVLILDENKNVVDATHTIELSFTAQTIHTIAPQYMPCVTLETVLSLDETTMSEADAAKLDALAAVGMPAVIKFKYTDGSGMTNASAWCSCSQVAGYTAFKCYLGVNDFNITFTFVDAGDEWVSVYSLV